MKRILVIEDETKTAQTVRLYLEKAGFAVDHAADGRAGLRMALEDRFDLIVLDLMLPGIDGLAICRRLREESTVRIIMLTAKTTEADRVEGLDLGADDYVPKPFSPRELVSRVRAVLRRGEPEEENGPVRIRHGDLLIDMEEKRVTVGDRIVDLTWTELRILKTLVLAPGRTFSRLELVDRVLGPDFDGSERTIDAHVNNLRKKIEEDRDSPRYIQTVFGMGYRLVEANHGS